MTRIYLDHAATTPVRPEVLAAMIPYFTEEYGNASALHSAGQAGREAAKKARQTVAELIGAEPEEIYFTSGGTESDNQALRGVWGAAVGKSGVSEGNVLKNGRTFQVITTAFEHKAILNTCAFLEQQGVNVRYLQPSPEGVVTAEAVEQVLAEVCGRQSDDESGRVLVSVMTANNELGTIQPIAEIGAVCRKYSALFHTDAVQAIGHIPVDVNAINIDLLSASAHKFGGPKGVGFMYVRKGVPMEPLLLGGGQEHGMRSGTLNTPGIAGLGKAAEISACELKNTMKVCADDAGAAENDELMRIRTMRDRFEEKVLTELSDVTVNGSLSAPRLPGHSNLRIRGVESESLLILLDMNGICASGGSACAAGTEEVSHVLTAIGMTEEEASECVRCTFGGGVSEADAARAAAIVIDCVRRLRSIRGIVC